MINTEEITYKVSQQDCSGLEVKTRMNERKLNQKNDCTKTKGKKMKSILTKKKSFFISCKSSLVAVLWLCFARSLLGEQEK